MPVVQNSYQENIEKAVEGAVANTVTCDVDSWVAESAINFGRAVKRGTNDNQCEQGADVDAGTHLPTNFVGITIVDPTRDPGDADTYKAAAHVNVLWRGDIWVKAKAAVRKGDSVQVVAATGELTHVAADDANGTIQGAVWMTDAAAGNLGIVRLDGSGLRIATS